MRWSAIAKALTLAGLAATAAGAVPARAAPEDKAPPAATAPAEKAGAAVATDARLAGDKARTRFVVDLDHGVDISVFALADPYRVIVDVPQIEFRMPPGSGEEGKGLVSAFRYGTFAPGRSRIVLDATGPVAIDKSFVLPAIEGQPARLVVDLVETSRQRFLAAEAEYLANLKRSGNALAKADRPPVAAADADTTKPVVVIDPGHGGIDSGTVGVAGSIEKVVVLEFGRVLKAALEKTGAYRVLMTRDDDTFVALGDRVKFARDNHAALFVSIHADSLSDDDFRGATVYTVGDKPSDDEAAALAEKENRADIVAGLAMEDAEGDVADILFELTERETRVFSVGFARNLVGELKSAIKLVHNPHRSAGLRVLRAPDVPSVLVELGYLSNVQDEKLMATPEWRERTATAIVEAIGGFFSRRVAQAPN